MKLNPRKLKRSPHRGATAVEFAMVAPVFVIVIAVCGEFARLSMMRNLAQNAAYEAARFVITEGATVEVGIAHANQILSRVGTANATVTINGSDGVADDDGNVNNQIQFNTQTVRCSITIPLKENSAIIPSYFFGETKIEAAMTLRTERYRGFYDGVSTN